MARVSRDKHDELEAFWRFHYDEWVRGILNQREYCELHGLPLKRFGNWRTQFKLDAKFPPVGLLHRRGGLKHMASHMSDRETGAVSPGYIPSAQVMPGASLSAVAGRHRIGTRLLFAWRQQMSPPIEPVFMPVVFSDGAVQSVIPIPTMPAPVAPPIIVERAGHEIEVELVGGRRVRFGRDTDPVTVRAMVMALEGELHHDVASCRHEYAPTRWDGLSRFLDDGRIELDTNLVERAIRPVALGRKNHLFAGSDGSGKRWATMASLIETCKLNRVEPTPGLATSSVEWPMVTLPANSTTCCPGTGGRKPPPTPDPRAVHGRLRSKQEIQTSVIETIFSPDMSNS